MGDAHMGEHTCLIRVWVGWWLGLSFGRREGNRSCHSKQGGTSWPKLKQEKDGREESEGWADNGYRAG